MATAPQMPDFGGFPRPWQPGGEKTGSPPIPGVRPASEDVPQSQSERKPSTERRGWRGAEGRAQGRRPRSRRYLDTTRNNSHPWPIEGHTEDFFDKVIRPRLVQSLQHCGRDKEAKALATCGLYFDIWAKTNGTEVALVPCHCDSPFCPDCSNRRSAPMRKKLEGMVNRPGRSYWFLTLTVPNQQNITRESIRAIAEQFGELWESWVFQEFEGPDRVPMKIFGGVRSIECVYSRRRGSWHPHIHVLLECPKKLPLWWLQLLKTKWLEITGTARYVRLQPAYYVTKEGRFKKFRLNHKALRELCKYVTKTVSFAARPELVDEFLSAFKGCRRVQFFGAYYGKEAKEFEREPGSDDEGIRETLKANGYNRIPFKAHITDTEIAADGSRQLTFEFAERVRLYVTSVDEFDESWELRAELQRDDGQGELALNLGMFVEQSSAQEGFAF